MYETLNLPITAPQAAVIFAALIGLAFGALAERTRFCFRRALVGDDRKQAAGVWLTALATALIGTQAAVAMGWISFDAHRFFSAELPWLAIAVGGALFGAGMVLTRGCVSRLTVLSGTGNMRALLVLVVFAIVAHAALKGVLAPVVTTLAGVTVPLATASLADLPGGALVWSAAIALPALAFALRSGNRVSALIGAALIGALVPVAWVGTGFVLYDDFDPIALQSLAFTSTWTETLFFTVASTAIPASFGVGLIAGVLAGAFLSAATARRLAWQSFTTPSETGRYMTGAALMGLGGVLAGGCTVGAGLSGIPTLSVAALLALTAIAFGALGMNAALTRGPQGARPLMQPAE